MASEGQVPCVSPQEKMLRAGGLVKKSLRLIGEGGGSDVRVGLPRETPLQFLASSSTSRAEGLLQGACFVSSGPSATLWLCDSGNALGT